MQTLYAATKFSEKCRHRTWRSPFLKTRHIFFHGAKFAASWAKSNRLRLAFSCRSTLSFAGNSMPLSGRTLMCCLNCECLAPTTAPCVRKCDVDLHGALESWRRALHRLLPSTFSRKFLDENYFVRSESPTVFSFFFFSWLVRTPSDKCWRPTGTYSVSPHDMRMALSQNGVISASV